MNLTLPNVVKCKINQLSQLMIIHTCHMIHNFFLKIKPTLRLIRDYVRNMAYNVPKRNPDFIIIGATRCGTTYLYNMLQQHPDIFMPQKKELHYFNHDGRYQQNLQNYRSMFHGFNGEPFIGEATPMYMEKGRMYNSDGSSNFFHQDSAIARINTHMPEAKFIISLRDPISRLLSMYKKSYGQGKINKSLKSLVYEEFSNRAEYFFINRSRYDLHLENILRYFPQSSLKIIIFEEWIKVPQETCSTLCEFIGAESSKIPINLDNRGKNNIEKYQKRGTNDVEKMAYIDPELDIFIKEKLAPVKPYIENLLGRSLPWEN